MSIQGLPTFVLLESAAVTAARWSALLEEHFGPECVQTRTALATLNDVVLAQADVLLVSTRTVGDAMGALLDEMRRSHPDLPVLVLARPGELDAALTAVREGASDYLILHDNEERALPVLVAKNLAIHRTRRENLRLHQELTCAMEALRHKNEQLEQAVTQLQTIAATDPLTALANRRAWDRALGQAFLHCHRYGRDLSLLMIDLDAFKQFNDTYGHQRGDELLGCLAKVLEANCRRTDTAGRYGGDEFVVLLPETDLHTARLVAHRIIDQFELAMDSLQSAAERAGPGKRAAGHGGTTAPLGSWVRCTLSLGLASLHQSQAGSPEQLLAQADSALYQAKTTGKNRLCQYNAPAVTPAAT